MSLVGLACGLIYSTRGGINWLGAIDEFINSSWGGIALLGLLECVVVGWAYRIGRLREHANERSDWKLGIWWDWIIRYLAPIVLSGLFVWSLMEKVASSGGFLYTPEGDLNTPVLVGLITAVVIPIVSVVLSLVPSPGANRHAQLLDRPRRGRTIGMVGTLAAVVAFAAVAWGFELTRQAYETRDMAALEPVVLLVALAMALVAAVLGAVQVHRGEKLRERPSGMARLAAGLGVMGTGAAGGLLLALAVMGRDVAAAAVTHEKELISTSYLVLAGMVALLVIGLGWCFYRAIKAVGTGPEPEQFPENGQET